MILGFFTNKPLCLDPRFLGLISGFISTAAKTSAQKIFLVAAIYEHSVGGLVKRSVLLASSYMYVRSNRKLSQNARNTRHKTRHFSETHLMNTPALWQSRRDKSHSNRSLQSSRHGSCLVLLILPANSLPQPTILKFVFFSLLSPIIYIA